MNISTVTAGQPSPIRKHGGLDRAGRVVNKKLHETCQRVSHWRGPRHLRRITAMKIAFYSPFWPVTRAQNGIVTYVDIMTRALQAAGHECVVITPRMLDEGAADDKTLYVMDPAPKSGVRSLWPRLSAGVFGAGRLIGRSLAARLERALERASTAAPVDIIDIEESFGMARFIKGAPTAVRLHGPHFLGHVGDRSEEDRRRIASEGRAIQSAGGVTSPSPGLLAATKDYYREVAPLNAAIGNPVEFPPDDQCWRRENCDPNLILFVGRFDLRKGADVMLEAFSRLAKTHKSLRLVMAGKDSGIPLDSGETLAYEAYVKRLFSDDIRERVRFLGPVSPAKVNELRRQALVYVSSSRFECCAYAVTETLAMGCPAVASSTFGPPEYLKVGEEILVFDIGDADGLAAQLEMLLGDPRRAEELGAAGRYGARAAFAPEKIVTDMVSFYGDVIARKASAS